MNHLVSILDNGGATIDRYTISVLHDDGNASCYGACDNPFHPMGFGQYCGDYTFPDTDENPHVGQPVTLASLPEPTQRYVAQLLA